MLVVNPKLKPTFCSECEEYHSDIRVFSDGGPELLNLEIFQLSGTMESHDKALVKAG